MRIVKPYLSFFQMNRIDSVDKNKLNLIEYDRDLVGDSVFQPEPYRSRILPMLDYSSRKVAFKSAARIYQKFVYYKELNDFIGMDISAKYLKKGQTVAKKKSLYFQNINSKKEAEKFFKISDIFYSYFIKTQKNENYIDSKRKYYEEHNRE